MVIIMNIKDKIINFLGKYIGSEKISEQDNLFEMGFLTSLDVLDLVEFIENEFSIELDDDDIGMEYLGTITGIIELVNKYC